MADEYDEEEEFEEISDEEKLRIATHFLLSAPAGEAKELLADVRKVVPAGVLTDAAVDNIFRTYNTQQHTLAPLPAGAGGGNMIVSTHGEVDNAHYVDPRQGKVFGFDHLAQAWEDEDGGDAGDKGRHADCEEARAACQAAMDTYVAQQYGGGSSGDSRAACAVYATGADTLVVCTTGQATNLRNWWSGSWKGEFTVTGLGGGACQIAGSCQLLAHYFEDGNVQMNTEKSYSADGVAYGDADELGAAVAEQIKAWESSLQAALESMYASMSNQTFKDMRRILPVTYTKFDWSGHQSKMAGQSS